MWSQHIGCILNNGLAAVAGSANVAGVRYADSAIVLRDVGQRVRKLRQARGLTQVVVARELKVATQRVQFIEAGKANLTLETLVAIANTLDAPIEAFFTTAGTPDAAPRPQVATKIEAARNRRPSRSKRSKGRRQRK
jgi:transcriptional regulator with XRE-family HTH domain